MNTRTLAAFALATSPFLFIGMMASHFYPTLNRTRVDGAWSLLFMTGWICALVVLHRAGTFDGYRWPKRILYALLASLTLANLSNLLLLVTGNPNTDVYFALDLCWPLSNTLMFVFGLVCIGRRNIPLPVRRWILLTGTWLPAMFPLLLLFGKTAVTLFASAAYAGLLWPALAVVVWRTVKNEEEAPSALTTQVA